MICKIFIRMDNAAFQDNGHAQELCNILHELLSKLEMSEVAPGLGHEAQDSNGNNAGILVIEDD